MAEKIVHETIEPTMRSLDERVAALEKSLKMGAESVEAFTKEKPMIGLGFAFLLGFLFGVTIVKSKC